MFLAHQFRDDDVDLKAHLVTTVLQPAGYSVVDGRADGMEQFRTAILSKIRVSRFFLCLLTRRAQLVTGGYASSVWLYQEVGAAAAKAAQGTGMGWPAAVIPTKVYTNQDLKADSTVPVASAAASDAPIVPAKVSLRPWRRIG